MSRRRVRTAAVVAAAGAVCLSGCTTVKQPGYNYPSLGVGLTILIFVVVPLAIFGTVALLAALPSLLKRPRYRPGGTWEHDPMWFGGPEDADAAIDATQPGNSAKGGASAEW